MNVRKLVHVFAVSAIDAGAATALLVLLGTNVSASERAERVAELERQELNQLRTCRSADTCPVFFVAALGEVLPIPTRYMLLSKGSSPHLTFTSPADAPESANGLLSGRISIRPKAEMETLRGSSEVELRFVGEVDGVAMFRMESAIKSSSPDFQRETFVLSGAGGDYVIIADDNRNLAMALLQLRARLRSLREIRSPPK